MRLFYDYVRAKQAKEASQQNFFLFSTPRERMSVLILNLIVFILLAMGAFQATGTTILLYISIALLLLLCSFLLFPTLTQPPIEPEDSRYRSILDWIAELNPFRYYRYDTYWGGWNGGWGVGAYLFLRLFFAIPALMIDLVCGARRGSFTEPDTTTFWIFLGLIAIIVGFFLLPYLLAAVFTYLSIFFHTLYFAPSYYYRVRIENEKEQSLRQHIDSYFESDRTQNHTEMFDSLLDETQKAYESGNIQKAASSLNSLLLFVIGSESQKAEREKLLHFLESTLSLTGITPLQYFSRLKHLLKQGEEKEKEWAIRLVLIKFQEEQGIPFHERLPLLRTLYAQLWTLSPHPALCPFLKQVFRTAQDVESWEKMKCSLAPSLESRQWQMDLKDILWAHLRLAGLDNLLRSISSEEGTFSPLSREEIQKTVEGWKNSHTWTYHQLASALEDLDWSLNPITMTLIQEILSSHHPDARTLYILASLISHSKIDVDFTDFALFALEFSFHVRSAPAIGMEGLTPLPLIAEKVKEAGVSKASQLYRNFQQNLLHRIGRAVQTPLLQESLTLTA